MLNKILKYCHGMNITPPHFQCIFSSIFFLLLRCLVLWSSKKYYRPSLGTPIVMKIGREKQEMGNIWISGHIWKSVQLPTCVQ
jgi:hypothetical protein